MKFTKYAATAALAIATTTGIAAGTAQAGPALSAPQPTNQTTVVSADRVGLNIAFNNDRSLTVSGADFAVKDAQLLISEGGRELAALPLTLDGGRTLLAASTGNSVTLRAGTNVSAAATVSKSAQWFDYELRRAAPGALVGAIVGGIIGLVFFVVGAIPGALIGAAAGLLIAGGQPLIDAGFAYFQRR